MSTSDYIRFRVNHADKLKAKELFEKMGFSLTQAFNVFLKQSLIEGGLPFRPHLGKEGIKTEVTEALKQSIKDEKNNKLIHYDNAKDLISDL